MSDEPKAKGLLSVLRGAVDRHVKQRSRDTIVRNAVDDPAEVYARRVTENDACDFCSSRANGEPVDPSKVSEQFHQFCKCHFMLFFQETRYRDRLVSDEALRRIGVDMEPGADPDYFEKRDAMVLAALGRKVRFLRRHPNGARRADTLIDGELVEFKNPTGSGIYTVQRQIKSNLYGKNKAFMKPQSDVLLISNVNNSMTMAEMQESLAYAFGPESLLSMVEKDAMRKVILLDERTRRIRVYEMKEPTLRGSGPRRRQLDSSIEPVASQAGRTVSPGVNPHLTVDSIQFGHKMGEHVRDFGYALSDLSDAAVRERLINRFNDIIRAHDERLSVPWRGQDGVCTAYVKDGFVVIADQDGGFVSAFKEVEGGNRKLNEARDALSNL